MAMSRPLNYKHLRYFWMVARCGSIAAASARLHLTPHAISGQLTQFEHSLGVTLFQRHGRQRTLTDAGRCLLDYADRIFALGDQALAAMRDSGLHARMRIAIGVADSLPKSIAAGLLRTMLRMDPPVRLSCTEGRLPQLIGELGMHHLNAVLADRPMPPGMSVRAFSHLLGRSPLKVFAAPALLERLPRAFPALIDEAPFLMPGEDVAYRPALQQWLDEHDLHPHVVAECDDMALLKALGQSGEGLFVAPGAIAAQIEHQYGVVALGELDAVTQDIYLISTERLLKHPAMREISRAAGALLAHDL